MSTTNPNSERLGGRLLRRCYEARSLAVIVFQEMLRTRALTIAAALAFYFLMSMLPLLILFSSLLQFLPIPNVFQQLLNLMAQLVPAYAMSFVERILADILAPNRGKLLSVGILGSLWAASEAFSVVIESLDVAYEVPVSRGWLRNRLRALGLTLSSGGLVSLSVLLLILGPHFGHLLIGIFPIPIAFEHIWPFLRVVLTFGGFVAALECVYYLGPNCEHDFLSTLPGAVIAIGIWIAGSAGLSFYLAHLSNFNATYGSMGALIGLMLWFYLTALAILVGAELNAELAKQQARLHGTPEVCELPPEHEKPAEGPVPAAQ